MRRVQSTKEGVAGWGASVSPSALSGGGQQAAAPRVGRVESARDGGAAWGFGRTASGKENVSPSSRRMGRVQSALEAVSTRGQEPSTLGERKLARIRSALTERQREDMLARSDSRPYCVYDGGGGCAPLTPAPLPRCQRGTFAFDRVLYRDAAVEVTPSALTHRGILIEVNDVAGVYMLPPTAPPLLKPRWWQRMAPSARVRSRAPRAPPAPNLLIDVESRRYGVAFTMALCAECPDSVAAAIRDARTIVY